MHFTFDIGASLNKRYNQSINLHFLVTMLIVIWTVVVGHSSMPSPHFGHF